MFWVLRLNLFFSHDTSCRAGTPFKLGSTLYCEEPRMQRLARSGTEIELDSSFGSQVDVGPTQILDRREGT